MVTDWRIQRKRSSCSRCSREFEPGQALFSALYETPEGIVRSDFCPSCWTPEESMMCFWKTSVPVPEEPSEREPRLSIPLVVDFFVSLEGEADPLKRSFRYVLALYLMRKKQLKFADSRSEGDDEILRLRWRGGDEITEVWSVNLDEEQIAGVAEQLGAILRVNLDGDGPARGAENAGKTRPEQGTDRASDSADSATGDETTT